MITAVVGAKLTIHVVDGLQDRDAGMHVERAGRFIAEENFGPLGDGARNGHALLFSARHLRGEVIEPVAEIDQRESLGRVHGIVRPHR